MPIKTIDTQLPVGRDVWSLKPSQVLIELWENLKYR
jgi:hypothetical protein